MNKPPRKYLPWVIGGVIAAAGIIALIPRGITVETGKVDRGPLEVSVLEDGRTRIKERYTVSAPLAGKLERIRWRAGDRVRQDEDVIAVIVPNDPALLDPSARAQADARVHAAEALQSQTGVQLDNARVKHEYAAASLERTRKLFATNGVSHQDMDNAEQAALTAGHAFREAQFAARVAEYELELARAVLLRADGSGGGIRYEIPSPVSGSVLRVFQESSTIVTPGTRLLEVGDPAALEIEVDVLSADAVQLRPGARAVIEHWGGEAPLAARVRVIEPSAFTKVSALGVEEQRVNVILDFAEPVTKFTALGDGFRVEARLVLWESPGVLRVPSAALFRRGNEWAAFQCQGSRAVLKAVQTGRRSSEFTEIIAGLSEGDEVILYPGDLVEDDARIRRESQPD
jgi:HlyD family secretion protein